MSIFNFNGALMAGSNNSMGSFKTGCMIGNNLTLGAEGQTIIGKYNQVLGSNYIFIVGTGSSSARKNAMTISANGSVNFNGTLWASNYSNLPDRVTSISGSGNTITWYKNGIKQTDIKLG